MLFNFFRSDQGTYVQAPGKQTGVLAGRCVLGQPKVSWDARVLLRPQLSPASAHTCSDSAATHQAATPARAVFYLVLMSQALRLLP